VVANRPDLNCNCPEPAALLCNGPWATVSDSESQAPESECDSEYVSEWLPTALSQVATALSQLPCFAMPPRLL